MSNHTDPNLNLLLLRSVPMDKCLKRYFISKYRHLVRNNGLDYANAKFKLLESSLKTYKSGDKLPNFGMRRTGWVKKLILYMDSQPHHVLNFLKGIYSWQGEINVDASSRDFHHQLQQLTGDGAHTPTFLTEWLDCLMLDKRELIRKYHGYEKHRTSTFHRYCKHHKCGVWLRYWETWKKRYRRCSTSDIPVQLERPVFPELYRDHIPDSQTGSQSFERDVVNMTSILAGRTDIPTVDLPQNVWDQAYNNLSDDLRGVVDAMKCGDDEGHLSYMATDFMSGAYVGDIHYIPKSGTGYRPIAVPNRFIQRELVPLWYRLDDVVKRLPQDATFDQDKFDTAIMSRINTDSRFIGSVDISQATDTLPFKWILPFVKDCILHKDDVLGHTSLDCFQAVRSAQWFNDGYMSKWTIGQPLGTLPSFCWLALTHHLFSESLSLKLGFGHSPYRILGDDIVIFSKRLHRFYVREMTNRGIPLSLSKSYTGKLSEFAGKVFIKKNNPFLTPDHSPITWNSLFDWQFSTGITIPWRHLPSRIRSRITRHFGKLAMSGQQCYELAQLVTVPLRGSTCHVSIDNRYHDLLVNYFRLLEKDNSIPTTVKHTGIIFLQDHVLTVSSEPREMGGYFRRFYQARLPEWYRKKFRPTSTDNIFSTLRVAMREGDY